MLQCIAGCTLRRCFGVAVSELFHVYLVDCDMQRMISIEVYLQHHAFVLLCVCCFLLLESSACFLTHQRTRSGSFSLN